MTVAIELDEDFYSLVYDLDDLIVERYTYFGIFVHHYFSFVFNFIIMIYEINFIILKNFLHFKLQTNLDIIEIWSYYLSIN